MLDNPTYLPKTIIKGTQVVIICFFFYIFGNYFLKAQLLKFPTLEKVFLISSKDWIENYQLGSLMLLCVLCVLLDDMVKDFQVLVHWSTASEPNTFNKWELALTEVV